MWPGYENGYRVPGKYSVHGSAQTPLQLDSLISNLLVDSAL